MDEKEVVLPNNTSELCTSKGSVANSTPQASGRSELRGFDRWSKQTRETLNNHETPPASCVTHLLPGGEVPHSDGAVLGHCCYLLPLALHREAQHGALVGPHQRAVVPGLHIQVAQSPSSCRGQDFLAVWADADRTHGSLMLWERHRSQQIHWGRSSWNTATDPHLGKQCPRE